MQVYLPIAEMPVSVLLILAMAAGVGFISGLFGIGGGFLMTPLLIFVGIAPAVAVASVSPHIAASSCSGAISYWRRKAIDLPLAMMLLAGGTPNTTRSGVIRKPPPIPNIPEMKPTTRPIASTSRTLIGRSAIGR